MPSLKELEELYLHLHFFVDTNFPDDPSDAAAYLREMFHTHRIRLTLASVGEEELNRSNHQDVRDLVVEQEVALGVGAYGKTLWGRGASASEKDVEQQAAILEILT